MLYYQFNGYEGFKEIFGMNEHGNGVKSRRNKILLALMKDRNFWRELRTGDWTYQGGKPISESLRQEIIGKFYALRTMGEMRELCIDFLTSFRHMAGRYSCDIRMDKNDRSYLLNSDCYQVDNGGVCFDGDTRAIRYINHDSNDRIYKMKAGKFMGKLLDESKAGRILSAQVKTWLCEDFAERWQAYAKRKVSLDDLHVSDGRDAFKRIYTGSQCHGDFGSCMAHNNGDHSSFYVDAVSAKAAWLTNEDGMIVARCVIFTEVYDDEGNKWRLAERQYSSGGDNVLKRLLVDKLIAAGEIDGYKQVGVDCHNARAFVKNDGTSLEDVRFHIRCSLDRGDVLSYQDSFKWYDESEYEAYNYAATYASECLDETDLYYGENDEDEDDHDGEVWSEYHEEYIDEDDACYSDERSDYFYASECHWCENTRTDEFEDDCVQLNDGSWAFYGRNCCGYDGVYYCDECEEYYLESDECYSEITEQGYCCDSCRHEAEQRYMERHKEDYAYDEVSAEWFDPREEKAVRVLMWDWNEHRRRNGVTRESSRAEDCVQYGTNWYYENVITGWSGDDGRIEMPREIYVRNEQAKAMAQAA